MLKRYQRPNKAPSSRVLNKEPESAEPALSETEAARGGEGSEEVVERRGRGLNLKEEEGARDQDRRVKEDEEEDEEGEGEAPLGFAASLRTQRRECLRGLLRLFRRREREGERVKAALCIFEI